MAALDFPSSPTTGQTYTGPNGVVWQYDGSKWLAGTAAGAYAPIVSPAFTGNPTAPTPPVGDADTSLATTAFVAASTATALTNVGRNLIHNSMFNISQRGTGPFTAVGYTLDRWFIAMNLDTNSISKVALNDADRAAIGDESAIWAHQNVITGNAGAAALTYGGQKIEGVRRLSGKTITISFWAKAASGTPKLGFNAEQDFGATSGGSPNVRSLVTGNSVTLSTSWARYSTTFAILSTAGRTLGTAGADCTIIEFWYSCGATNAAIAGNIGVQTGTIQIWGVQLEIGSTATPLEKLDPQQDLANCQRFYWTTGPAVVAGNATGAAFNAWNRLSFPAMRAVPLVNWNTTGPSNITASGVTNVSTTGADMFLTSTGAGFFGATFTAVTASADL